MSIESYVYKQQAITAAKELYYSDEVIAKLQNATTEFEISCIMHTARNEMFKS